ncbi:5'/3'-nucleotidase SurE [Heliophilum fasciatum]|uniref:5'-nucleotidase SurE n=1 Tax=Heliophilum fasciatum TaxID=35700 RepID=A0A4V2SWF9_9FIRM|nr:5'/3'-nucleotidase SurE [Heliophilum fasciatum]MCW2278923.1 5'-nucleotidase [Heliophilum fasciatum]TCP62056.1 5'-nucleotidase /3'-nucleotidase /exopolyphosphatase [Heliophilum fasciatum]
MRILFTNDDGIHAPGIRALWQAFAGQGDLIAVAPDEERSATGHGITVHKPLRVESLKQYEGEVQAWSVNGTPADCIKLAFEAILTEPPDLVISGINRGPNLATDVLYSGTVSAAVESVIYGVPAIAISMAGHDSLDYQWAAKTCCFITQQLLADTVEPHTLLNINVPVCSHELIKGIRVTRLGQRRYRNILEKRIDPRGKSYYWIAGEVEDVVAGEGTDIAAVADSYISVTPLHFDLTDEPKITDVAAWLQKQTVAWQAYVGAHKKEG